MKPVKLSTAEVLEVYRRAWHEPETYAQTAAAFGISASTVGLIKRREGRFCAERLVEAGQAGEAAVTE